jgi:type VI protein secretion system component Hcp
MSFIAKLKLDGEEMNVLHCGFRFSQVTDATGKPTAKPQGGTIDLVIESSGAADLFDWMVSATQTKNGTITFYRRDTMSKLKTLEFTEAFCVDYYETFDHQGKNPMQIQLTLTAREVKLNDSAYKNNWPGK